MPSDCDAILSRGSSRSGVYRIQPKFLPERILSVYCTFDTEDQGWITIQRRVDSTTNFNRLWYDYKVGFGNLTKSYWIGLDALNFLAGPGRMATLRVDLTLTDNPSLLLYAVYNEFAVEDESTGYKLTVGEYDKSSTLPDALSSLEYGITKRHSGKMFSTKDRDNDENSIENCAAVHTGGWWFNHCRMAHLNGRFINDPSAYRCDDFFSLVPKTTSFWHGATKCHRGIAFSEMKIRYKTV